MPSRGSRFVQRRQQEIGLARPEKALGIDQFLGGVVGLALPGPRMGGASGGRGRRFDRYASVDGRFDREVGERLKDGARRSFHNFEPR